MRKPLRTRFWSSAITTRGGAAASVIGAAPPAGRDRRARSVQARANRARANRARATRPVRISSGCAGSRCAEPGCAPAGFPGGLRVHRKAGPHQPPAAGAGPGGKLAAVQCHPLAQAEQAPAGSSARGSWRSRPGRRPVVGYLHHQIPSAVVEPDAGARRPRVLDHIGQCLLDDAERRQVQAGRQARRHVAHVQFNGQPGCGHPVDERLELRQAGLRRSPGRLACRPRGPAASLLMSPRAGSPGGRLPAGRLPARRTKG